MGTFRQVFIGTKFSSIENANKKQKEKMEVITSRQEFENANKKHKSEISASERHNKTSYDKFLQQAHELERYGEIERGTAKEWAREQIKQVSE